MASQENNESRLRLNQTDEVQETSESNENGATNTQDEGAAPWPNPSAPPQLNRETLQAMTRSWWGSDEDDDEENASLQRHDDDANGGAVELMEQGGVVPQSPSNTSHESVDPPLKNATQETLPIEENLLIPEETGEPSLPRSANDTDNEKDAFGMPSQSSRDRTGLLDINDDDPSLHPPVASMPRYQDDEDDEKEAYRLPRLPRQTSPMSARRQVGGTDAGSDTSNESPRGPELHRQANLDPRPGAVPINGRSVAPAPDWAHPQPESRPRQQPIRRHQGRVLSDLNLRFHRTNASSIQNADIAEANAIDDAEAVVYATSVNPDNTAKIRRVVIGLGILSVLIIVGLSVGLTYEVKNPNGGEGDDPWCLLPLNKQDVFARCLCSGTNTTEGLRLMDEEITFYNDLQNLLQKRGVINGTYTIDSCEPQNQCMVWSSDYLRRNVTGELARLALSQTHTAIQSHVLCMTYLQLDGRHWQVNDQWLTEANYCEWFGVSCSFLSRITAIELPSNVLNGTFPSLLHHMPYLRELDLSRNPAMQGTIPSKLTMLSSLRRLDLSHASMTGTIPTEIERFEILDRLVLSNNSFSGMIPISTTKLRTRQLYLDCNKLNGSLPTEFGNLARLELLYLDDNLLSGMLPSELGRLDKIVELSLSNNTFSGTLCTELGLMRNLEILRADSNHFNGTIPTDFAPDDEPLGPKGWRFLQEFNLSNNSFSGPFPEFLGDLNHLVSVSIHDTQLTGTIPETFCAEEKDDKAAIILDCKNSTLEECSCCKEVTFCADSLPPGLEGFARSRS